ncbi:hypothetical protein CRENBAI_025891 [Crenichthys baileyi]|uniref:THAP-type domain-containing protein n=1 Tax=Crenichthys baileyi TaxID=28760 RepID=A0AAV9RWA8_9TELE
MACCVAVGCSNRSDRKDLSFYRFPKDPERRTLWVEAVSRLNWSPTEYSRICSKHFISGQKSNNPLSPDYVPSLFAHTPAAERRGKKREAENCEESTNMTRAEPYQTKILTAATALLDLSVTGAARAMVDDHDHGDDIDLYEEEVGQADPHEEEVGQADLQEVEETGVGAQTNMTGLDIDALSSTVQTLLSQKELLTDQLKIMDLSEESFKDNDEKTKVYTGWVGRTSDRLLAEKCGYLNNLAPGDTVLANRRFNIEDVVALRGATLTVPMITKERGAVDVPFSLAPPDLQTLCRKLSECLIRSEGASNFRIHSRWFQQLDHPPSPNVDSLLLT